MKRFLLFVVSCCFFLMACPPLPHHYTYQYKIEYNAIGRSGSEYILLENNALKYVQNREDTISKSLKSRNYKRIYHFLKGINLDSLETLVAPSKKHEFDGALATTLTISDPSKRKYITSTFDDGNPPIEIKGLVNYIKDIAKKK